MSSPFSHANPHVLASIVAASEAGCIEASEDIVDDRGVKLLARGNPVVAALVERLEAEGFVVAPGPRSPAES